MIDTVMIGTFFVPLKHGRYFKMNFFSRFFGIKGNHTLVVGYNGRHESMKRSHRM